MKVSKTENQFKTGFQQPKTGLQKKSVLTSLNTIQPTPRNLSCFSLSLFILQMIEDFSFPSSEVNL